MNGHNGLRAARGNVLHACVLNSRPVDAQGGLSRSFCLKRNRKYRPVAANARGAGGTRSRELQDADHAVVAVHQRDRLPVLRQQGAMGDVHHL